MPAEREPGDGDSAFERAELCRRQGNDLLAKGDFADACQRYDEGLLALVRIDGSDAKRVSDARLALHSNAALAHLKRGNLASAVEHASGALAVDPKNVKALYRRGVARYRLAEHKDAEANAALARADLEQALELEPSNAEVRAQLQQLRAQVRAERKEVSESQKQTFRGMFSGQKQIYEEVAKNQLAPIIRCQGSSDHRLVLSAEKVSFHYNRGEPVLEGADLELRAGWCVGLVGNNASGKTTLARILEGRLSPTSGRVVHHVEASSHVHSPPGAAFATSVFGTVMVAVAAVVCAVLLAGDEAMKLPKRMLWWHWALVASLLAAFVGVLSFILDRRKSRKSKYSVLHVSSDMGDKEEIPGRKTVESVIGEVLPRRLTAAERQKRVIAMLEAGGFQMYNQATGEPVGSPADYVRDGLQYGHLSGGQRHLIYVLRCFARKPDVMLCDELLGGLDAVRQPRVLHMLKRMQKEVGTAVLFIATELHQLKLVADTMGFMADGLICELGTTDDILEFPKHPATKDYVQTYRGLPGGRVIGGKLAENYSGLEHDSKIAGDWLPL